MKTYRIKADITVAAESADCALTDAGDFISFWSPEEQRTLVSGIDDTTGTVTITEEDKQCSQ